MKPQLNLYKACLFISAAHFWTNYFVRFCFHLQLWHNILHNQLQTTDLTCPKSAMLMMLCNQALIFPHRLCLFQTYCLSYFSHCASLRWPRPHPWRRVWAGRPSQTCPAECLMTGCLWNSCVLFVPSPLPCPCWQCPHCESEGLCFV